MMPPTQTIGTLFGGAGIGTSLIPEERVLWSVEEDPNQVEIWNTNHSNKTTPTSIFDVQDGSLPWVDVIQASPPCTLASGLRDKSTITEQDRVLHGQLLDKTMSIICSNQPRLFIIENVPGYFNQSVREKIFTAPGYQVRFLNIAGCGVGLPINRLRTFAVGTQSELTQSELTSSPELVPSWSKLLGHYLEPETSLGLWQKRAVMGTPNQPMLLPRYGGRGGVAKIYLPHQLLPDIRATANSRKLWTVISPDGHLWNVLPQGFAAAMGVPGYYQLPWGKFPRCMRAIGNGIAAPILPKLIQKYLGA